MKNNKTLLLILVALFVALLVGAGILYGSLSDQYNPSALAVQTTPPTTAPEQTAAPTDPSADTTAPTEASPPETTAPAPQVVPNFIVTDQQGNQAELYDFLGKPIILNFWASWCGPCRSEMPDIDAAYQTYGQDIHFLIVNLTDGSRETMGSAADYIAQAGYAFPIYFDTTLSAASAYGAYSIPVTYFISANGQPVAYFPGAMTADILQQGIDLLLSE